MKNAAEPVPMAQIPVLDYADFAAQMISLMSVEANHCVLYYAFPYEKGLRFMVCVARDEEGDIAVFSHHLNDSQAVLESLTPRIPQLHLFEREMHENFGVKFENHPWMKPVRTPFDLSTESMNGHTGERSSPLRAQPVTNHQSPFTNHHSPFTNSASRIDQYPFYRIDSEELHEVGVGPIHAGVIEPGHFRFICNGEKVLHLEIMLGYQHRGVERMMVEEVEKVEKVEKVVPVGASLRTPVPIFEKRNVLRRAILAENIAGDTAVGHGLAHAQLMESLAGIEVSERLKLERSIALELERIAVHIGDTAALCTDVAYQLGQVVNEALRTTIINTTQFWCGNRFGKGLIRPGGTQYPLTAEVANEILRVLEDSGSRYVDMANVIFSSPTVLARFDEIGTVTKEQAALIGVVGMAAKTCGIPRDIRKSHPFAGYKAGAFEPVVLDSGDVLARGMLRNREVRESVEMVKELVKGVKGVEEVKGSSFAFRHSSFALSLTEGWRGEIAHAAVTDEKGELVHYKIKDPSFHNWMALQLAVRNQEISDFPVCNKSFNLSYCGHDL
jgi:Ni,Fe-hydrogenase III large subunit